MNSYRKAKSVAKDVLTVGPRLEEMVLDTMAKISAIVGATLGPAGRPVLIERQEYGLPHIFTKDGVTVFRNLGFNNPTAHAIMEATRDAATRTVAEAGDGTTTATVLAEAIVRNTYAYCKANPKVSPQRVVRRLERVFKDIVEPKVKEWSMKPDDKMLNSVAKLSANGDEELAAAVMRCFDVVGDDGNISIIEQGGPSHYEVEALKGFPISVGYEESCRGFFQKFLNDVGNQRCFLENPVFILYNGSITEIQTVQMLCETIGTAWEFPERFQLDKPFNHNVVLVATGFSEGVIAALGANMQHPKCINVFPLKTPQSPVQNGEMNFIYDLAAVTGATVFDPINLPLDKGTLKDLGTGIESFEATRYRSTILGLCDDSLVIMRAEEIKRGIGGASKLDDAIIQERVGKLTGGVAKLRIFGASSGELREKRDRVEDAICAVRGAKKHGCLPGGGWTLNALTNEMDPHDEVVCSVLIPSLMEPIHRIFSNCGLNPEETAEIISKIGSKNLQVSVGVFGTDGSPKADSDPSANGDYAESVYRRVEAVVYDAWEGKFVDAIEGGILDSTPAVLEAIRSSLSIASILGTTGGTIVFRRDDELERKEAVDTADFMKQFNADD